MPESAGELLQHARVLAGLSQRALANRAATAQSVVARVELGQVSPSWDTLARLVAAAGFRLDARIEPESRAPASTEIARIKALDAAARLQEMRNAERFFGAIARVT